MNENTPYPISKDHIMKIKAAIKEIQDKEENNVISHPSHYQGKYGMEVIDVIDNFACAPVPEDLIYDDGNAIKYLLRWSKKNGVEDLLKCKQYIDFMLEKLKEDKE